MAYPGKSNSKLEKKVLPYDFIPFPDQWNYVYEEAIDLNKNIKNLKSLPKHDEITGLCGKIDYSIEAQTDLAMDFRKIDDKNYQVSGSSMRGKIRSNLEILSASYPSFIDRINLTYRDIAGDMSRPYIDKLKGGRNGDIAQSICAGFLKKEGNKFFIESADLIGKSNFKSIVEDELLDFIGKSSFSNLFSWDDKTKVKVKEKRNTINKLTQKIEEIKNKYKAMDKNSTERRNFDQISKSRDSIFKTHGNFIKLLRKRELSNEKNQINAIAKLAKNIEIKLERIDTKGLNLSKFHSYYVERIGVKAELYIEYMFMRKNNGFHPYQMEAEYGRNKETNFLEIRKPGSVSQSSDEEKYDKVYLYNSTNASSKKSHYIVKPAEEPVQIEIVDEIVISYNEMLKNFKVSPPRGNQTKNQNNIDSCQTTSKDFYDIFANYQDLIKSNPEGIIVFYRMENDKLQNISRTPYLRVSYDNQIEKLIDSKSSNLNNSNKDILKIDYARALFGYVSNDFYYEYGAEGINEIQSYKSRLRFAPLEIKTKEANPLQVVENFTLMSPAHSAFGMYIKQDDSESMKTYEDDNIELNGYKYYKMCEEQLKTDPNAFETYKCSKVVLDKNKIENIRASVYFENLTKEELGLLILSLDINQIKNEELLQIKTSKKNKNGNDYFDSIGGAKPYGYGCVRINIDKLKLDYTHSKPQSIDYWINENDETPVNEDTLKEYIAATLDKKIISEKTLSFYLTSKQQKKNFSSINWENLSNKIQEDTGKANAAGYPKNWILGKQLGTKSTINYESTKDILKLEQEEEQERKKQDQKEYDIEKQEREEIKRQEEARKEQELKRQEEARKEQELKRQEKARKEQELKRQKEEARKEQEIKRQKEKQEELENNTEKK